MSHFNPRKLGLSVGLISVTEWIVIAAAFLARYLLQFYQTSIGYLSAQLGLDPVAVGIAFALFSLAFALAAFVIHRIPPARLVAATMGSLLLLGATMPLYLVAHGLAAVYLLMVFDGLLTGIFMDALMTIAGMAAVDPAQRQTDQAAFSFWVSTALIVAPLTTGALIAVLDIKSLFALLAILSLAAIAILALLRGDHALKYVGHREPVAGAAKGGVAFVLSTGNRQFKASLIAALGNKIPYFVLLAYAVLYGKRIGIGPAEIFYLVGLMFMFNLGARMFVMLKSPVKDKTRYMAVAMTIAMLAAASLPLAAVSSAFFFLAFPLAGIPEGLLWPIGLQVANTTFKSGEIASSTAFFSSGMMGSAILMPLVGYLAGGIGYASSFAVFTGITFVFFAWLMLYLLMGRRHAAISSPLEAPVP